MSTSLKRIALIGTAALVGVLLLTLVVGTALAQGPGPRGQRGGFGWGHGPGMMGGWRGGPGMMGGYGFGPSGGITGTVPYGPAGCPGMGGWGYGDPGTGERLSLDEAAEAVEAYLATYDNPDLVVVEVMEFTQNFYAEVEEESTGIHAMELLVDPFTGVVFPEYGPNMMWNTKYGHMSGRGGMMMGYGYRQPTDEMTVSPEEAVEAAQAYLDQVQPGLTADDEAETFYGYYTLHVLEDGQIVGMLSVNGFTGQVWYHNWHGDFIGMTEGHED